MAVLRMDHVSVVVSDLDAAIAYFTELGLVEENRMPVSGKWVDRVNGMDNVRVEIVMMVSPDGGKLELTKFRSPALTDQKPGPANTLGLRSVMFEVEDVVETVARLRKHGGELIGEIADYENIYRLCYTRGPDGIIVALAQAL